MTRHQTHPAKHSNWNESVHHLYPYHLIEKDEARLAQFLAEEELVKERDLNIQDVLRLEPEARRRGNRRGQSIREEEEEEEGQWPLPPLQGCPTQGVLTVEPGAHLGTLMTQFAILYSLSRRDGKHAFLPPELEIPLRKLLSNL